MERWDCRQVPSIDCLSSFCHACPKLEGCANSFGCGHMSFDRTPWWVSRARRGATLSSRMRALFCGATALGVTALSVLAGSLSAAASTSAVPTFQPGPGVYDVGVHTSVSPAQAQAAASSTFTHFTATVKVGTTSYTYVMAGQNPAVKHTNPASTIQAKLIPLIIKFSNGDTWDPTKIDSCDSGASAATRVTNSPIVASQS